MFRKLVIVSFIIGSAISLSAQSYNKNVTVKDTITDRELMIPEDMERNFDQLLIEWRKDLKPSITCDYKQTYSVNSDIHDSIYINRLYSLPSEMELAFNPIVRSYIDMYTGRRRNSVEYFLGKSHYFFPIFEQALDKYGLPLELKYLPIIESALNPTIVSRAGATGLWQFMIGTGKMYNLEINSLVDERRDPLLSTDAAARYLKDLYNIYGDWNLVIAAYNCGPGNVNKAIRRSGGATDYWTIYPYLPRETRGYVPAFIAATYIMNYYKEHNICPSEYDHPHSTDTVQVDKYLHLQQIADVLNISLEEIQNLNPQYKKGVVPGEYKKYLVTLPSHKASDFEVYKDAIYSHRVNELLAHRKVVEPKGATGNYSGTSKVRHKVRRGETLSTIASKHRVTVNQLKRWNGLKSTKLRVGQVLAVNKPTPKSKTPVKQQEQAQYYAQNQVESTTPASQLTQASLPVSDSQAEESSASNILSDYFHKQSEENTEIAQIEEEPQEVKEMVDNSLNIESKNRVTKETQTIYHKVRIGETLSLIASKYDVSKEDISSWNKLKAVPKIGQRLVIHLPEQSEEAPELKSSVEDLNQDIVLAEVALTAANSGTFDQYKEAKPVPTVATLSELEQREATVVPANKSSNSKKSQKAKSSTVYTVRKGDTLGHIADKFGGRLTSKDIMKANKLRSDKLKIGQKLKIPR
jgi:Soluble lytic murein transglycosylase and related regulatory proteins (some contain LysM/invasin domains)